MKRVTPILFIILLSTASTAQVMKQRQIPNQNIDFVGFATLVSQLEPLREAYNSVTDLPSPDWLRQPVRSGSSSKRQRVLCLLDVVSLEIVSLATYAVYVQRSCPVFVWAPRDCVEGAPLKTRLPGGLVVLDLSQFGQDRASGCENELALEENDSTFPACLLPGPGKCQINRSSLELVG